MKSIEGKSLIVTGGSNGIGEAAALLFAENGAKVTVADVNSAEGQDTVEEIVKRGGTAQFIRTDISDPNDVQAMVAAAVSAYGKIDGAFNNAGVPNVGKRLHEVTFEEWQRYHAINLAGTFLCIKYEVEQMLKTGGGAIVNTASVAGLVNVPLTGEYTASKHGVSGLTKAAASDYGHDNIRVNAIAPGAVRTAMFAKSCADNPELEEYCKSVHPIGRFGEPIEEAEAAMWLLSDAASFVTGIVMPVDGGYTAV
ncbi:glucose 1-dehydrogenase [Tsuneonella sp. CC-YZS046]|uniref:SDR family NAD(P)-dependent oxidoreductase n=1 Tax=Tsuneonella sp. CC-YZS046 TaxID=3042152 RepID=UPI002D79CA3D|nr:glucose 1-dehydrogenase [Tsuneonella sp. CC-YZS046]WRO67191.1 glucose 1-dehydrogenase [Tsuneonella sp. CC-YZS046]